MTKIEWADATWNPVTGCDRVSPGCDHCYALSLSARLKAMGQPKYQTDGRAETSGPGFGVTTHPDELDRPLSWATPRRVFVCSMSDLFHPQVPAEFIDRVWAIMSRTPQHTYQVLTKRPQRMRSYLVGDGITRRPWITDLAGAEVSWPLPNVWLGVSVEDQQRADQRIPQLLATPAAVRFVSAEPLLGPVTLRDDWLDPCARAAHDVEGPSIMHLQHDPERRIGWLIVGGESGPQARPMHPAWARQLRDQCQQADVAFFFKQWGSWTPAAAGERNDGFAWPHQAPEGDHVRRWCEGSHRMRRVGGHGGRELDGQTWDQYPDTAEVGA